MDRLSLCILFGGQSSEHDVSCVSASNVLENLDKEKYDIHKIGITKKGEWLYYEGNAQEMRSGSWEKNWHNRRAFISPDAGLRSITILNGRGGYTHIPVDVVFPVLHGKYGEDGTVQGLLELAGIPYVGPHVLASATAMDKVAAKTIFAANDIPQARWLWFYDYEIRANHSYVMDTIENTFDYPVYVKPANAGSSIGITKAEDSGQLVLALEEAMKHDRKILIEETIIGREMECAVMGNREPIASPIGEVLPSVDFYDYDAKYHSDVPNTQVPAELDEETMNRMREQAIVAYKALDCQGLSRVDFFLREDGEIILNEINTLPGFTSISMYPQLFASVGVPYAQLLDRLIDYALED